MTAALRITGSKLTLRSITPDDLPLLYEFTYGATHREWKEYDAPYFPLDPMSWDEYEARQRKRMESPEPPSRLGIEVEGALVGAVNYYWEHKESNWLEAGIVIYDAAYWSGGYGTEALKLWVGHLFANLPLVRVGITTWSGNPRMMRCGEKVGMQLEGRMRKCRYWNGQYYDSIRMGILREEWEALQGQA